MAIVGSASADTEIFQSNASDLEVAVGNQYLGSWNTIRFWLPIIL